MGKNILINNTDFNEQNIRKFLYKDRALIKKIYDDLISHLYNIDNKLVQNSEDLYNIFDKKFNKETINITLKDFKEIFARIIVEYLKENDYLHSSNLLEFFKLTLKENNINVEDIKIIYPLSFKIYPFRNPHIYLLEPSLLVGLYNEVKKYENEYPDFKSKTLKNELFSFYRKLIQTDNYLESLFLNCEDYFINNDFYDNNVTVDTSKLSEENKINKKIMIISGEKIYENSLIQIFNELNIDSSNVDIFEGEYDKLTNLGDRILATLKGQSSKYLGVIFGPIPHSVSGSESKSLLTSVEKLGIKVYRNKDLKLNISDLKQLLQELVKDSYK